MKTSGIIVGSLVPPDIMWACFKAAVYISEAVQRKVKYFKAVVRVVR